MKVCTVYWANRPVAKVEVQVRRQKAGQGRYTQVRFVYQVPHQLDAAVDRENQQRSDGEAHVRDVVQLRGVERHHKRRLEAVKLGRQGRAGR
jgi:hypothetical protein